MRNLDSGMEKTLSLHPGTKILSRFFIFLALLIYSWFFYLMICITVQYIPVKSDVAFLTIKQDYVHLAHYRFAFFTHVFSSIFSLLAGFTQFSAWFRNSMPLWHRRLGWLYVLTTVLLSGPSGLVIGIYANGGIASRIAFCLLAVLWMLFTVVAVRKIVQGNVNEHHKWMIRSFALALSAITLRAWKYVLVAWFHPKPMDVYQVVAWLGWVLNLAIAELIIFKYVTNEKTA